MIWRFCFGGFDLGFGMLDLNVVSDVDLIVDFAFWFSTLTLYSELAIGFDFGFRFDFGLGF